MTMIRDPQVEGVAAEMARLQGTWQFVAGQREAAVRFSGDRFEVRFQDGACYTGTFQLNPTHWPRTIDMKVEEGPEEHRGLISLGIYKLEADTLRWSPGEPGRGRPRCFPTDPNTRQLDLFFKRQG